MQSGNKTKDIEEAFAYLVEFHTITEAGAIRNPRYFRYWERNAVDHNNREEVGKVERITSYHCFRTIDKDNELHVAEVSCFCQTCCDSSVVNEEFALACALVSSNARAAPTIKTVQTEARRARDARDGWYNAFIHGVNVLRACQAGDWVLVYYDVQTREYWNECDIKYRRAIMGSIRNVQDCRGGPRT